MKPRVAIIVAIDEKRGIGKNNELLFKIPEDFKRMRSLTSKRPIILGRKNFESIGRVLPNRTNIVITRNKDYSFPGAVICHSLKDAIEKAKHSEGAEEIFIFGGGQVYAEALEKDLVERIYLTVVNGDYGADTFFPDYSAFKTIIEKEEKESDGYRYTFLTLEK